MGYLNKIKVEIEKLLTKIREKGRGDTAVGLDIGKHSIKLVQLKRQGEEVLLSKIDSAAIAPGSGDNPEENQAVKKLIAGLFARNGIESKKIILGINGQSAFIKFLEILPVKAEKLEKTLKYEAQQQIPFSLDEVEWDSHLFGPLQEKKTSAYRVLLIAVKKDRLAAKEALLEGLKRHPSVLDVSNLSLYNCIRFNRNYEENKLSVVLNIGAQSADLLILKGENLWMRSIAIGGDNITAALAKKLNTSFTEAQELKQKSGSDNPDIKEAVAAVLEDLQGEISRSIEFITSSKSRARAGEAASPIEEILLSGGGSLTQGLDKFLAEKFSCRVRYLEPFKMLRLTEGIKNKLNSQNKALFSQAVGWPCAAL